MQSFDRIINAIYENRIKLSWNCPIEDGLRQTTGNQMTKYNFDNNSDYALSVKHDCGQFEHIADRKIIILLIYFPLQNII